MPRRTIEVEGIGHGQPIPTACVVGDLLMTGSVSGRPRDGSPLPAAIRDEIEQAFVNLRAVLDAADVTFAEVAKLDVLLADTVDRSELNEVWCRYFPDPCDRPVRHTEHRNLPAGLRVQLLAVAVADTEGDR